MVAKLTAKKLQGQFDLVLGNDASVVEVDEFEQVTYIRTLHRIYLQKHISVLCHPLRSGVGKPFIKLLPGTCFFYNHLRHTIIISHCRRGKLL
jgi:hypothetical protein